MSHYATKSDLKNAAAVDTSIFIKKTDLASIKSDIDDFHIDKLKTFPVDLEKIK